MERTEHLIVGQGLAGSVLGWTLWEEGADFRIIDKDEGAICSKVSGGMINPISPRIPTMAWNAKVHLPEAEHFYTSIQNESGTAFYHPRPIYRPYQDEDERKRWQENAKKKGYEGFLWPKVPKEIPGIRTNPELGMAVFQGAFLDSKTFLECSSKHFLRKGLLHRERINPSDIEAKKDEWEWKGIRFKKLILCQGTGITQDPFFGELPLRPNKGEILTVHMPGFPENFILNRGFYAIPLGNEMVKIGATYDHKDLSLNPTQEKKDDLLERMEKWIDLPYEVCEHEAGHRPTTPDTRPYVGFHREWKGAAIFNGMGSKGASLAPHWAKRLTEKLKSNKEEAPDPTVDPNRFLQMSEG